MSAPDAAKPGQFITLEGSEGVGKSTNMAAVCDALEAHGIDYVRSREPGGTGFAEALREVLLAQRNEEVDGLSELLVVFAARKQHLEQVIKPALKRGQWVVCDRFTDATYAYQGGARGQAPAQIATLEEWVQEGLQPALTIYLDLPPELGRARIADREHDRMERENLAFFEAVRAAYLDRAGQFPRFRVIDAAPPLAEVRAAVHACVDKFVANVRAESGR
ncbi:MAG: dTMP kinase [Pseudomonadota bacterium]